MADWLISLIAAFTGAFGGTLLNRQISIVDKNNLSDKGTLSILKLLFFDNGLYRFLLNHQFGEPYDSKFTSYLEDFTYYCNEHPDFKFINKDIEENRIELLKLVKVFTVTLIEASISSGSNERLRIPNPDFGDTITLSEFEGIRKKIDDLASEVTECYKSLINKSLKLH